MFYIYHTLSYSSVFPYTTLYRSLRDAAPAPRVEATLTRTDVVAARRDRGARWAAVRELWLSEKATDRADRAVLAADLDTSLARADTVADDEAVQRSRVAAHDARIEAHVEGLDAARREELAAEKDVVAAADHRLRVADEWAAEWARIGLVEAPGVNEGPAVRWEEHTSELQSRCHPVCH